MEKLRLDELLVKRGIAQNRSKAQAIILAGLVLVNDQPISKAGALISVDAQLRLRQEPSRFVSRGGDKIDSAFNYFKINLTGLCVIDIGASTGGFTDCMLQRGASRVYAVDVGHNQLDFKLRGDPRVVVLERTHILELNKEMLQPSPSLAVVDLSFIGLRKVIPHIVGLFKSSFQLLLLVKPQFELEPEFVSKGGVVREEKDQLRALSLVEGLLVKLGLNIVGSFPCPLKGAKKGNQEYFLLAISS